MRAAAKGGDKLSRRDDLGGQLEPPNTLSRMYGEVKVASGDERGDDSSQSGRKKELFLLQSNRGFKSTKGHRPKGDKKEKKKSLKFIHVSAGDDAAHVFLLGARKKKCF